MADDDRRRVFGANLIEPRTSNMPEIEEEAMVKMAAKARENAYTPYSGFKVGAAVRSWRTGKVYAGCNVENSSYGATICAERNAVLHAVAAEGELGIDKLVVVSDDDPPAPPCAMCLQVLAEFCSPDTEVTLAAIGGRVERMKFSDLLPRPFIMPGRRQ